MKRTKWTMMLAAALGTVTLAGAGVQAEDFPTVKVCIPNYDSPAATADVEAAINAIAGEKYGFQMDLEFIATGNWAQQTNLMLTSDEVDVFAVFGTPFLSFVNNGQLLDLTDYWANASEEFKAEWTEDELLALSYDGKLYAIPNTIGIGEHLATMIDAEIAAEFGLEDEQEITWEELDEFLQKAHEKYPERYGLVPTGGTALISNWTWDGMGDKKYLGVLADGGYASTGTTVVPLFEAEDFLEFTGWARKWYEDGITMPDILSNSEGWKSMFAADKAIAAINSIGVNKNEGLISVYLDTCYASTDSYHSVSYAINANSSHPDAAWAAMEALYTDKDIQILLTNGIEGQTYVVNEDGTASYPEGMDGASAGYDLMEAHWFLPYVYNTYPLKVNGGADFFDKMKEQKAAAVNSKGLGFVFDNTEVIDEYTACSSVMDKYYKALMSGAVDPDEIIAQAAAELESSGLAKIIEAKQAQLDAFLAEK
ncbi:MAG: ABC transporter substrate-binding protein [Eubacteriales bacterium]|nr:ABC transporter substrate-binding protein [Eubacteriales bacterium]